MAAGCPSFRRKLYTAAIGPKANSTIAECVAAQRCPAEATKGQDDEGRDGTYVPMRVIGDKRNDKNQSHFASGGRPPGRSTIMGGWGMSTAQPGTALAGCRREHDIVHGCAQQTVHGQLPREVPECYARKRSAC